jgi:lysophospholipase L1-like esterase
MRKKPNAGFMGLGGLRIYLYTLCVFSFWPMTGFAEDSCKETYTLPSNQWHQISLPCKPQNNRVSAVFGDDIRGEIRKDWAVFDYNSQSSSYRQLNLNDELSQGKAYWIIQKSGKTVTLNIQGQLTSGNQTILLDTKPGAISWNMIAYPFNRNQPISRTRVITDTSQCTSGCNLSTAKNHQIVHDAFWHYNSSTRKYTVMGAHDTWSSWRGYWAATLENSHGSNPRLVIPKTAKLSIMLLGDSITQSTSAYHSYRYYLWKNLLDSGVDFDFVGGVDQNHGGNPQWPNYLGQRFDSDHQSHWGKRADEVLNILKRDTHKPDIALIHLGTNDEIQGHDTASTIDDLRQIVANLRGKNPQIIVLLAKIIPYRSTLNPNLNNSLPALVAELNNGNSPVRLVDQNSGFDVVADTFDRIHPNTSGEQKMATRWYQAIMQMIN